MFAIILGVLVVIVSVGQYLVCPLWYPSMCNPALATAIIFGLLGFIGVIAGVGVHFEQKSKQRDSSQSTL